MSPPLLCIHIHPFGSAEIWFPAANEHSIDGYIAHSLPSDKTIIHMYKLKWIKIDFIKSILLPRPPTSGACVASSTSHTAAMSTTNCVHLMNINDIWLPSRQSRMEGSSIVWEMMISIFFFFCVFGFLHAFCSLRLGNAQDNDCCYWNDFWFWQRYGRMGLVALLVNASGSDSRRGQSRNQPTHHCLLSFDNMISWRAHFGRNWNRNKRMLLFSIRIR